MTISSRTPEGRPNLCPVCGSSVEVEPSDPPGDAPCPRCGHLLWFTWRELGESRVIRPTRDTLHAVDLGQLAVILASKPEGQLVLDLAEVRQISSAAFAKLVSLKQRLAGSGKFKVENLHPDLHEVFRIVRLDWVFEVGP